MKPPAKICISLGDIERQTAITLLRSEKLGELRLDLIPQIEPFDELLNAGAKCIVTCRPSPRQSEAVRRSLLKIAIEHPVYAIDLDIEDPLYAELKEVIFVSGVKLILSYHNFTDTPGLAALDKIRNTAFDAGADIFKIATLVNSKSDAINLLSLLKDKREQVIVGMGELGKIVRVTAPYLGSLFTYVSPENAATAPGQLESSEMKKIWQILGEP